MKISTLLISVGAVAVFVIVAGSYYTDIGENYNLAFQNDYAASFSKMAEIQAQTSEMNQTLRNLNLKNPLQFATTFVSAGYQVIETSWDSFDVVVTIAAETVDRAVPGDYTGVFRAFIFTLLFVSFMFIIISALVGRDI